MKRMWYEGEYKSRERITGEVREKTGRYFGQYWLRRGWEALPWRG
jgi:hypothetical protein